MHQVLKRIFYSRHRSKKLPLFSSDKKKFLSKVDKENENSAELINKIENYCHSKIYYHNPCQLNFSYKMSVDKKTTTKTVWHDIRQHHQIAFDEMCVFIRENVIEKGRCYFLTYLYRYYKELLEENETEISEEIAENFSLRNVENKIMKVFNKDIKYFFLQNKKIIAPKNLTDIDEQSVEHLKDEDILHKAALILRKSVLRIETTKLPKNISATDLKKGEASAPKDLLDFFSL